MPYKFRPINTSIYGTHKPYASYGMSAIDCKRSSRLTEFLNAIAIHWGLTKTRTGPDHRTTINFCARSQKCACALDCKDLEHSPGLWPKRYQGNTVTIQRNDQTCVLAASHAAYASLLPYVNEHIQGQEMTKEDIEKTLPGPCTCFPPHPPDGGSFLILSTL